MDNRPEIEGKLGMPLGEKGSDRKAIKRAFEEKGLTGLSPITISRIKAEMTSGAKTNLRLDISRLLEFNNVSAKNNLYQRIAQTGIQQRIFNSSPQRAQLFKTDHYTEDIAGELEEKDQAVRQSIRAMRTDMVLAQVTSPNTELTNVFCAAAENYIALNLNLPPSLRPPAVLFINDHWDHRTMKDFYTKIYNAVGGRGLGSWTPYEMETFSLFYIQQKSSGDQITPFDRIVLNNYLKANPTNQFMAELQGDTGIKIDEQVIERHRNVLVYGTFSHDNE